MAVHSNHSCNTSLLRLSSLCSVSTFRKVSEMEECSDSIFFGNVWKARRKMLF